MFKVQIESWHGDGWQELSGNNEVQDSEQAAHRAAELYVYEAAAYESIDGEPIIVWVDDDILRSRSKWEVSVHSSLYCTSRKIE